MPLLWAGFQCFIPAMALGYRRIQDPGLAACIPPWVWLGARAGDEGSAGSALGAVLAGGEGAGMAGAGWTGAGGVDTCGRGAGGAGTVGTWG